MCGLLLVVLLSLQTMEARILERGKTSGRVDDNVAAIKKRFRTCVTVVLAMGRTGCKWCD